MHIKRILQLFCVLLALPFALSAQVTTGNVTGTARTISGEALPGATIEGIHEPTGTVYRTIARKDGRFDIPNVIAGGPYTFKATFVGFEADSRPDTYITLGETQRIEFRLKDSKGELAAATVTGRRTTSTAKSGSETLIGRDKMINAPTVGRNLNDFVKFTPQVKITSDGGIAIAGQNNRFNAFLIDGAVNNDVFGLSASGTNGGQAGTPPISIDAIDQIAVQISNFDASIGNFTGGSINAVTRQGTNNISGSLYYYMRNPSTTGRSPLPQLKDGSLTEYERAKSVDFKNQTFGFRVGGPIIKNKLFFFINAEKQDDERPQPFNPNDYRGTAINDGGLAAVVNHLKTTYGYDPGQYTTNPDKIDRFNLNTRFDLNIDTKNKLTFSYRYTNTERINPGRSGQNSIQFYNGAQLFPSTTNSGSLELNSRISNKVSNKARVTFTNVKDDRGFIGDAFPGVTIFDGTGSLNFGSEVSSSANLLKQSIINIYDVYKVFLGKHALSGGVDIDFNNTYNLFINRNFGLYQYNNVADFLSNAVPSRYRRGYSLVDANNKFGDEAVNSAAEFKSWRLGLFVNDDIRVNDHLTLTVGLRADRFEFLDKAPVDKFWTDTAEAKIIAAGYDLKGAKSGQLSKPRIMLSPRFGFRYNIDDEGITFRGGIGLFTGRTPLVWPGGVYQNTGVTIGAIDPTVAQLNAANVRFRQDVRNQYTALDLFGSNALPQGDLNLIAGDYKLPQVLRSTAAIDKRFGKGWSFTIEATMTKNLNETFWSNVSIVKPNAKSAGVGARDIIVGNARIPLRATGNTTPYTNIILIENTTSRKGYAWNGNVSVDKVFSNNWSFNLSYGYGVSAVNNEGTSSVNTSNWQNMENVTSRNMLARSTSDFDMGHRILAYFSKKFNYAKGKLATTVSLVYNGQSGSPISYVQSAGAVNDGVTNNDLVYVPASRAEVEQMVFLSNTFNGVAITPAQQRDLFWNFIQSNKYLRKRAGQFAERNGDRLPFTNVVDFKLQQDVNIKVGSRKMSFQVTFDVFNLTNLINSEWGRQYFANFDAVQVLQFAGYTTTPVANTPQYRFSPIANNRPWIVSDGVTPFNNSRWAGQLGLRFNF